ncbi:MAG TPA: PD-(D/E)XK nuclease family protein [Flexivirga sp.]|uniref:PD-(D/E)XK nuclease family protein n=1 Tax=Flexivirga sp. TaxID=1962927 RepID=UPI002B8D523C|nr:PD-(D/E)XK nuclease family protein [Flexivirga sp.]HWC23844.1 PD-(D/E)XK nuclease family protein [Flexivirga sp.]
MGGSRLHGAAYGPAAIDKLRHVVSMVKAGDMLAPVTVIVPNHLAGLTVRRALATGLGAGQPGIAAVECLTVAGLAERIAAPVLAKDGSRPAADALVTARIRDGLIASPGEFGRVATHPATALAVGRASRELRQVGEATLATLDEASGTLVREVIRTHNEVWGALSGDWYDGAELLRVAADNLRAGDGLAPTVIYLPGNMHPLEIALLRALASKAETHVLLGLTGYARTDEGSRRTAAAILGQESIDVPDAAMATARRVIHASDADDEVRAVTREVVAALDSHPAHRIAVLYGNRRPYARILHEQLQAADVTFNGPGSRPVVERAYARFVLGLLDIHRSGYPRGAVMQTLAEVPTVDVNGQPIPTASWERLSRNCGVVGGNDWEERVGATIADLKLRDDPDGHLEHRISQAQALQGTTQALRAGLEAVGEASSWFVAADRLRRLILSVVPDDRLRTLPGDEQYARGSVLRAIDGLAVLDESSTPVNLAALEDVVTADLQSASIRVGRFGEGAYVGPVESAIGLDLDVVIVCGLSEDIYPGRLSDDPLLPEAVRETSDHALVTLRERIAEKHRALLAAFASADTVIATFARGDLRQQTNRIPSRWLLPSIRKLSGDDSIEATRFADAAGLEDVASYTAGLTSTKHLANEQEWRLRAGLAQEAFPDVALSAVRQLVAGRSGDAGGRFDGMLGIDGGRRSPFSENERVAPTTLEEYAGCPHTYFVRRILHVQPIEDPESIVELSRMDFGNFIHHCFDVLISEAAAAGELPGFGEPWGTGARARLDAIADEHAVEFEQTGRAGHPRLWRQSLAELKTTLARMLDLDDDHRAVHKLEVVGSEVRFGFTEDDIVELDVPGGRIRLKGSADKVDRRADGTLIVTDIKTGKAKYYKDIGEADPVLGGSKLQLPAYGYGVRALYGDDQTPVEAEYWFVGDDDGTERVPLPLTAAVDARYRETLGTLSQAIENGLFPHRPPEDDDFSWVQCQYCNPDGLGYGEVRARWRRLRRTAELRELVALIEPAALVDEEGE